MSATPDILLSSIRFADQYPNIQAAVTDAGKLGAVIIPPDYPGSDGYTNPNRIAVLDFRPGRSALDVPHGGFAANLPLQPNYQGLGLTMYQPTPPAISAGPMLTTPLGWVTSTNVLH